METAEVTPFNPEGENAVQIATAFYLANGGKTSEAQTEEALSLNRKDKKFT